MDRLPCDVLLVPHPFAMALDAKPEQRRKNPAVNPFADRSACRAFAATQRGRLEERIAGEQKQRRPAAGRSLLPRGYRRSVQDEPRSVSCRRR